MENSQENIEKRVEKIKSLFKDKYQVAIIAIVVFAFAIRVYYLFHTSGQTLWWDEAEYGSMAKHFFLGLPYELNNQRPFMFPWLIGVLYGIGASEMMVKFISVLIPSTILVYLIYLLGSEMFDKKIGLIAAFFGAVSWTFLFWTVRLQPDSLSMCFQVLAVYFMWRYWKIDKNSFAVYAGIFASLGFNFKVSGLLVPLIFLVFIIIKDRASMFTKKGNWLFAIAFFAALLPQFIYSYYSFGSPTSFLFNSGYSTSFAEGRPANFATMKYVLGYLYRLTENLLYVFFLVGWLLALKFLLYIDIVIKDKKKSFNPELFAVLAIVIISLFYIFYIRTVEDRWVFLWLPFVFMLSANAMIYAYNAISKYNKTIAIVLIAIILATVGYMHVTHADEIIEIKKGSYEPVKMAGEWMKQNSNPGDIVYSISLTQTPYYSERETISYSKVTTEENFSQFIDVHRPLFLQISLFEPHPKVAFQQGEQNGYNVMVMPYLNSSIVSQSGNIVSLDLKPEVRRDKKVFKLVYPTQEVNGVFVYEISYENSSKSA